MYSPVANKLLPLFMVEKETLMLVGITNRVPRLVTQNSERHSGSPFRHTQELMSLRKGLHVIMLHATAFCCLSLASRTSWRTRFVERKYEDEHHERIKHVLLYENMCVDGTPKDAIEIQ